MLVSRIMSDVEGVRNLIGTGLVEFVGGLLTAIMAFGFLLHASVNMTLIVFAVIIAFVFILQNAFKTIRPIFRERAKINAEVTGRLTESLGGVRVIKGYHAEAREANVFAGGVQRLLDNVMKSLTATSLLSFAATTVLGVVGGLVMLLGGHAVLQYQATHGAARLTPAAMCNTPCCWPLWSRRSFRWSISAPSSPRRSPALTAPWRSSARTTSSPTPPAP